MLKLYFSEPITDSNVFYIDTTFNLFKSPEWFNPMAIRLIEEIDGNKYIADGVSDSPVLGIISPGELSGGIKTLIYAMNNQETVCPLKWLGQNLSRILVDLTEEYDVRFAYNGSVFIFEEDQKICLPEYETTVIGNTALYDFIVRNKLYDTVNSCLKIELK